MIAASSCQFHPSENRSTCPAGELQRICDAIEGEAEDEEESEAADDDGEANDDEQDDDLTANASAVAVDVQEIGSTNDWKVSPPLNSSAAVESAEATPIDAAPLSPASGSSTRYFEFRDGTSGKFWEIALAGKSHTVRFGKIGAAGQKQTKAFASLNGAKSNAEQLIREKVRKGYIEVARKL